MSERDEVLAQWLAQWGDMIKRTCCLCLSDETLAEDAAQDTFVKAWRSMAQFEGRNNASAKTWLVSIAMNVCRNYRRSFWMRRMDRRIVPEELPASSHEDDRELLLMVEALPDSMRDVVVLRYFHGMSLEEAAKALGIGRSTCHHRLQKALRRLRMDLQADPDGLEKGGAKHD